MEVYLPLPQPGMARIVLEPSLFSVITTSESESGQLLIKKKKKKEREEMKSLLPPNTSIQRFTGCLKFYSGAADAWKRVACLGGLFPN